MTEAHPSPRIEDLPDGTRRIVTAVRWQHEYGAEAVCLGRVYIPKDRPPVVILSEVESNRREYPLGTNFSAAASSLVKLLAEHGITLPETTLWHDHYGPFSYYETFGDEETYSHIPLHRDGDSYTDDIHEHRLLTPAETQKFLSRLPVAPVKDDIASVNL